MIDNISSMGRTSIVAGGGMTVKTFATTVAPSGRTDGPAVITLRPGRAIRSPTGFAATRADVGNTKLCKRRTPMRSIVIGLAAGGLSLTAVPAAATETTVSATVRGYQAPDFSQNFTQLSSHSDIAYLGVFNCVDFRYCGDSLNGRLAATMEFALPALPEYAVVTNARLGFANFESYEGPNFYEMRTYTAASFAPDPARIYAGAYFTTFQLQPQFTTAFLDPNNPLISFDVTSIVASGLAAASNVLGFSFRQTVDNCGFGGLFGGGYECGARFGDAGGFETPVLRISYDIVPPPPPASAVPEPASWAMFIAGFGLIGRVMRRRTGRRPLFQADPSLRHGQSATSTS